jgi:hypothetical protein
MKRDFEIQLEMDVVSLFLWQWHGREMFEEVRNDFRFPRKLHRVVYHLADTCKAPSREAAEEIFKAGYPNAKTTDLRCIGPNGRRFDQGNAATLPHQKSTT